MSLPPIGSWLCWLAMLALVSALGLASRGAYSDTAILAFLAQQRTPALDLFWRGITHLGSLYLLLPASALLLALPATRTTGMLALASLAGASLWCNALKYLFDRPRPSFALIDPMPVGASFPSAHSAQIFAFVLALLWSTRHHPASPYLAIGLLAIASLVAASRLYLQVHYPSDVLAGALLALLWCAGLIHWIGKTI